MMKRKFALLLAISMILTLINIRPTKVNASLLNEKLNNSYMNNRFSQYEDDSEITVLIELEEKSVLENYNYLMNNQKLNDRMRRSDYSSYRVYAVSDDGEEKRDVIEQQQMRVVNQIEDIAADDDVEIIRQYTDIANVVVATIKAKDLEAIATLDDVRAISPSVTYSRPDGDITDVQIKSGNNLVYADQLEYKGDQMVVAILDTGCSVDHEAFSKELTNPQLTKEKISTLLTEKEFYAEKYSEQPATNADSVYINSKIPFAYDYADHDCDINPTPESVVAGNDHGNHVAGIIGADSDKVQGIVPDAQLVMMKVFPDSAEGAPDYVILDALQDCLNLEVDVINMSLGTDNGYTSDETDLYMNTISRLDESGICVIVSAGNSNSSADHYVNEEKPQTSQPDTATVGSPSTFASVLSVASYENSVRVSTDLMLQSGKTIHCNDSSALTKDHFIYLSERDTLEYVIVPGYGEDNDYAELDVAGKVAVVSRGVTNFSDKIVNAHKHDAIGLIIYNNLDDGIISMSIDEYLIPAVFISKTDGATLKNEENKSFIVTKAFIENEEKDSMSKFSSWGCTPDLRLKPEITGVGGNVYSALPFNEYGNMSGTSMSSPQIAGVTTAVLQYIEQNIEKFNTLDLTPANKSKLAYQLLISTANPVLTSGYTKKGNEIEILYSPRKQGSGLADAKSAIQTNVYLYGNDDSNERPIMNLGDDTEKTGVYKGSFHIRNLSNEAATYELVPCVMTETVVEDTGYNWIMQTPTKLDAITSIIIRQGQDSVSVDNYCTSDNPTEYIIGGLVGGADVSGATITINPSADAEIEFIIRLTDDDKQYINQYFENGEFVEGFLSLVKSDESKEHLGLPFMGFFGDWTDAPIFDQNVYDYCDETNNRKPSIYDTFQNFGLSGLISSYEINNNTCYRYLGQSIVIDENSDYDAAKKCIAFAPNAFNSNARLYWAYYTLRNTRYINYKIKDEAGTVLYEQTKEYVRKTPYNNKYEYYNTGFDTLEWNVTDKNNNPLPNNTRVNLEIAAHVDYRADDTSACDTVVLPIFIDYEEPKIKDIQVDYDNLEVSITITDNHYLNFFNAYNEEENFDFIEIWGTEDTSGEKTIVFDYIENCDDYYLETCDYAGNILSVEFNINDFQDLLPTKPTVSPSSDITAPIIPVGPSLPQEPETPQEPTSAPTLIPTPVQEPTDMDNESQKSITYDLNTDYTKRIKAADIETYLSNGENLVLDFVDDGRLKYEWRFDAQDYQPGMKLSGIKTQVHIKTGAESEYKNGVEISCAQAGVMPLEATLRLDLSDKYKPGQKLYLYIKSDDKLLCVPNSKYIVDRDGYVNLNLVQGGNYVLLEKAAAKGQKKGILNQVNVGKKYTLNVKSTKNIVVNLPATLTKVNSLKKFDANVSQATYGARITYKSNNPDVVSVTKNGKVNAKKKGKAKITVQITLSNGTKKKFNTMINVK